MSLLSKLFGCGSLSLLSLLPSPSDAQVALSAKCGAHFFKAEKITEESFSPGFAASLDAKFPNSMFTAIDLGISFYDSPGDEFHYTKRGIFYRTEDDFNEAFGELAIKGGLTLYLSPPHDARVYTSLGLMMSALFEREYSSYSQRRESYSIRDWTVYDTTTGYYARLGFEVPFKGDETGKPAFFNVETEYRNSFNKGSYPGVGFLMGVTVPIGDK